MSVDPVLPQTPAKTKGFRRAPVKASVLRADRSFLPESARTRAVPTRAPVPAGHSNETPAVMRTLRPINWPSSVSPALGRSCVFRQHVRLSARRGHRR